MGKRDYSDEAAERALAELAIKLPSLLERLVVALEKIAAK